MHLRSILDDGQVSQVQDEQVGQARITGKHCLRMPDAPGVHSQRKCPKCKMALVALEPRAVDSQAPPSATQSRETVQQADSYTCAMHPDIRTSSPGKCPKCAMALVPVTPEITDYYDLKIESLPAHPKPNEESGCVRRHQPKDRRE